MTTSIIIAVVLEACTILSAGIFAMILIATKYLPKRVHRMAIAVLINIAFISFFYLSLNLGWTDLALAMWVIFVPSIFTLGLFFYYFSVSFLSSGYGKIDKALMGVPIAVLIAAVGGQVLPGSIADGMTLFVTELSMYFLFPLFSVMLVILGLYHVDRAEKQNKEMFSNHLMVNLRWSKVSLYIYLLFIVGMIASEVVPSEVSEYTFNITLLLLTCYIGFYEVKMIAMYVRQLNLKAEVLDHDPNPEQVEPGQQFALMFSEIDGLIDGGELFLDMDISVSILGEKMGVNGKYISHSINSGSGKNFNSYINAKRIGHAVTMIKEDAHHDLSIEGIANECGFRSKSSFNSSFKKYVGKTPTQYIGEN